MNGGARWRYRPATSVPARSAHGVRSIGAPARSAAGQWTASGPAGLDGPGGRADFLLGGVVLVALVTAVTGLLLASLSRDPAAAGSAAQAMTALCRDLEADRPAAAYALAASSYRATVTEARFASTVLPLGSAAATCAYQQRTSGASSAGGVMTVTQRQRPTALRVTLTEDSAKQWQVTKISSR